MLFGAESAISPLSGIACGLSALFQLLGAMVPLALITKRYSLAAIIFLF